MRDALNLLTEFVNDPGDRDFHIVIDIESHHVTNPIVKAVEILPEFGEIVVELVAAEGARLSSLLPHHTEVIHVDIH